MAQQAVGIGPVGPSVAPTAPLSRFQRILVGSDGSVTALLEAYCGEPIEAFRLHQVFDTPNGDDWLPGLAGDEVVLRRRVLLRGRSSHRSLILSVGREPAGACATHFGIEATDELIVRTYRIVVGHRPVIAITEKFPTGSFGDVPSQPIDVASPTWHPGTRPALAAPRLHLRSTGHSG